MSSSFLQAARLRQDEVAAAAPPSLQKQKDDALDERLTASSLGLRAHGDGESRFYALPHPDREAAVRVGQQQVAQ